MKFEYISHDPECSSLILIFSGWSTAPSLYNDVSMKGWDVAVVYDYSNLSIDLTFLNKYTTVWLFAWSLGVKVAAATLPPEKITAAYAINGTLNPVDDKEGIPLAIYNGTADNLDSRNLKKFQRRMVPDSETYKRLFDNEPSSEEIISLKNQLYAIRDIDTENRSLPWRRAYIGIEDRIFPSANMEHSWDKAGIEIVKMQAAHYIPISDIVRSTVPNCEIIAHKFCQAAGTYDNNAIAQKRIAEKLLTLLDNFSIPSDPKILEIGPGTGMFSRLYSKKIKPSEIDFVDITPLRQFGISETERYHCEDAEKWILNNHDKYDCIFSSSTIQWFANIPEFLRNCFKALRPGGIILISSFLPGNLGELDALRPSPIHYHAQEEYESWFKDIFSSVKIFSENICLEFSSTRELMMHLKHTGVGGSAPSPHVAPSSLRNLRNITYRPIYLAGLRT